MTSATTDQIGGLTGSVAVKPPCRVSTTANITLSGLQAIDGVTVVEGDRVLVKNQSTTSQNGIYVASSGTWQRSADFDGNRDVVKGTRIQVHSGAVGAGVYKVTTADPILIDSSAIAISLELSDDTAGDIATLNDHYTYESGVSVATYANMARGVSNKGIFKTVFPDASSREVWGWGVLNYTSGSSSAWVGHVGLRTPTSFPEMWVGGQAIDKFAFREGIDRFGVTGSRNLFEINDVPDDIFGHIPTRDGSRTPAKAMWTLAGNGLGQSYGFPLGRNNVMPDGAFGGNDNLFEDSNDGLGWPKSVGRWLFLTSNGNEQASPSTGWAYLTPGLGHTAGTGASVRARRRLLRVPAGTTVTVEWELDNMSAGAVRVGIVGTGAEVVGATRTTDGSLIETLTTIGTTEHIDIVPTSTAFDGDIVNFFVRTSVWNLEGGWSRDATTGKPKHTPGAASKLWANFDFTLAGAVRLHEIEILLRARTAGNVKVYFENDTGTVSIPADALKPDDKASSPARLYASPYEADGTAQTVGCSAAGSTCIQYITAPELVAGVAQVTRVVFLASSDFDGTIEEVGAFIPYFGGGWGTGPRYGRSDAVGHFLIQDAVTFGRGGGVYFGSTAKDGLTTRRNAWTTQGLYVSAGLAGYSTAAVTYETMLEAIPGQFTAICSPLANAEYAHTWIAASGANSLATQDGLVTYLDSLVWGAARLVDGVATKVLGIDTATGDFTVGSDAWAKFLGSARRLYLNGTGAAAQIGSETGPLQVTMDSATPIVINRTTDDGDGLTFYQDGANEGGLVVAGNTVSVRGYGLSHNTQASGFDPRTEPAGTCVSTTEELCEWFQTVWIDPITKLLQRDQWSVGHKRWKDFPDAKVGFTFIDDVMVGLWDDGDAPLDGGGFRLVPSLTRDGQQRTKELVRVNEATQRREVYGVSKVWEVRVDVRKTIVREGAEDTHPISQPKCAITREFADPCFFGLTMGADRDGDVLHLGKGDLFPWVVGQIRRRDQFVTCGYDVDGLLGKPGALIGEVGTMMAIDPAWPRDVRLELWLRGAVKGWSPFTDLRTERRRGPLVYTSAS